MAAERQIEYIYRGRYMAIFKDGNEYFGRVDGAPVGHSEDYDAAVLGTEDHIDSLISGETSESMS